jgi:CHAD domain-containing protein
MPVAGATVMGRYWQQAAKRQRDVRDVSNPEAVHDMRVAVRRLRVAFNLFERWYDERDLRGFARELRRMGRRLGDVRDGEVILENARAAATQLSDADLAGLIARWDASHAAARLRLLEYFDGSELARFRRQFEAFLDRYQSSQALPNLLVDDGDEVPPYRVSDVIPALIWQRYGAVRAYDAVVAEAPAATMHRLRIAGKRLRYAIEAFEDLTGQAGEKAVKPLRQMQDVLGALHDAHVTIDLIQAFQTMYAGPSDVVDPYIEQQRASIATSRAQFDLLWQEISGPSVGLLVAHCVEGIAGLAISADAAGSGALS